MEEKRKDKKRTKTIVGLAIATSILGTTALGLGIGLAASQNELKQSHIQLENIYKRNYYDLVDSVNTADTNISKLMAATDKKYQAKMLREVSQSAKEMQDSIASLPLEGDNVLQSVRFVNQMSGYTQTLEDKINQGGVLSDQDVQTLAHMHDTLSQMKQHLNKMSYQMFEDYDIIEKSMKQNGKSGQFSGDFSQIKTDGTDYPTMIYDGPFSDSVVNQKVKGLSGKILSSEEVLKKVKEVFKNEKQARYQGQADGRFSTYNFELTTFDNQLLYVQATKQGGHILTVSGNAQTQTKTIDIENAKKIALNFAQANGVEGGQIVWFQELDNQAYFNITPTQNSVVLYPDLIKVKVDMNKGDVIGYDAISYWTNHTDRNLDLTGISSQEAQQKIDKSFEIKNHRVVLSPLDFNREVVCWEFECARDGATYYIYINHKTGQEENILKVVETEDGSKLM